MAQQTVIEFLSYLRSLDVRIWVADNQLRINAPAGILTPELQVELKKRKTEILAFLNSVEAIKTITTIQTATREDNPPLSFPQQQLWFLDRLNPGTHEYNMPTVVRLSGKLNRDALEKSINGVVSRHEILRTSFPVDLEGQPFQCIAPALQVSLRFIDLRKQPEAEMTRQIVSETQTSFNLSQGPLIRTLLIQSGETEHILVLTLHHIVSDAWAMGVLVNELGALYQAFVANQPSLLPDLPIQYADFAIWQRQQLQNGAFEKQRQYWQQQLAGLEESTSLPTDHPLRNWQLVRGGSLSFIYPPALTQKLKTLSQQSGSTLFCILLAAFNVLLMRYSGREDISIGTFSANRNLTQIEALIGIFINTLILRTRLHSNLTFQDLLKQVYETTAQAHANQDLPFDKLVESLRARNGKQTTLFHAMFMLQNTPLPKARLPELDIELLRLERDKASPNSDLDLFFEETEDGLLGIADYDANLFERATIERMMEHFETLLESIATNPEQHVMELSMLTEAEHQQFVAWNTTEVTFPHPARKCLHELFEAQVEKTPDAVAVSFQGQQLTYAHLNARANQLAHYLRSQGVGPEVLVGICVERSLEMIVGLLGILKAGGAYVPLDPDYPKERLMYMLLNSGISVVLSQERLASLFAGLPTKRIWLEKLVAGLDSSGMNNPENFTQPMNLAYAIFTSGSTGFPKGVMITHDALVNHMMWFQNAFPLYFEDRVLQKTPFSFDASVWEFWAPLLHGACLVMAEPEIHRNPQLLIRLMIKEATTIVQFVPSLLHAVLEEKHLKDCLSLRFVFSGGEPLSADLIKKFQAASSAQLCNLYGPTEMCIDSTFWPVKNVEHQSVIPIGRPIANTQIYILDSELELVPIGVPGELYIGGAGLARGYLNRPELTAEKFIPNPFSHEPGARMYRTGDLARWLPDGNIEYLGRIDHQVKIRGFRIELGEIEAALIALPEVHEVVVMAREDNHGDKRLVAYLVAPPGHNLPEVAELRSKLAQSLPEYMLPTHFLQLEQLPLSPNGKLDRKALPVPDMTRSDAGYVAPRMPTEEILVGIWANVLKLDKVGIHDNFLELGGHSLLATQVVSRVRQALDVELPLPTLFRTPTVAALAEQIRTLQGTKTLPLLLLPVPRTKQLPLSFAQQRLWFLDQFEPGSIYYNLPGAVRLVGDLDEAALQQTVNEIVRRHEALRTSFAMTDGIPRQVIAEHLDVLLNVIDLQGLPEEEREARAQELAQAEAETPFDLAKGPLIRVSLVRLDANNQIVLFTLHHIVSDGWSMGVLVKEVATLYAAFVQNQPSPLPELSIQYADFAHWQRQWLSGAVLQKQLDYWTEQLRGSPTLLTLPTDRPRPVIQSHRGAVQSFEISPEITAGLYALNKQAQTTLFMMLTAAFSILLSRYSGQDDICIGTPIANRNRTELEGLIGFFVNTLVLRTKIDDSISFENLLQQVRANTLDAYAHQDVPFEQLVNTLKLERHTSHSPLFQVMLAWQNPPIDSLELPGLTMQALANESTTAKFDLLLNIAEADGRLLASLEYNTDLFEEATIQRMAEHFLCLLEGIVANPNVRLQDLPLLSEVERQQLIVEWNATGVEYPQEKCIQELFEEQLEKTPEAVAVVFEDQQLTYAELNARANQLAHYLRKLGVGPEALVGICMERSLEMVVGLLGILKAGGAYVPLDPSYPKERLAYMMADAQVSVLLTQNYLLDGLPSHSAQVVCLDQDWKLLVAIQPVANPASVVSLDDLAYMIYTSGSTGKPKGALNTHRGICNRLLWMQAEYGLNETDRVLQKTPFSFDVSVWEFFWPLMTGAQLVMARPEGHKDSAYLIDLIIRKQITTLHFVPSMLHSFLDGSQVEQCVSLKRVICSGEALPYDLQEKFFTHLDVELHNLYGPTEAAVDVTYWACQKEFQQAIVPIGHPIANTQIYILDAALQPVPVGVSGELYIGGIGVGRGYHYRPELTAEKFIPDPFSKAPGARMYRTGDLARWLAEGNIEYLGRIDHQVKIRGFRIELGEIETALAALPEVREVVVLAREDIPDDKRLVAYLVGHNLPEPSKLRSQLAQSLPEYMLPAHFIPLEQLPLTPNGKVDRKALPAPDMTRSEAGYVAPRTSTEEILAQIWAEVLRLDKVGIYDNFFELGGHSLLAITLIERMRQVGLSTDVRSLFATPTIAALAMAVGIGEDELEVPPNGIPEACEAITPEMLPLVQLTADEIAQIVKTVPGGAVNIQDIYPLAPLQEGILFHHLLNQEGDAYLLPSLFIFDSRERLERFIQALQVVIGRHDILRTAVIWEELAQPLQVVWRQASIVMEEVQLNAGDGDITQQLSTRYDPRHTRLDVRQAPMLRGYMAQDPANNRWLLGVLFHHLALDHTTLETLIAEIQLILQGREAELLPAFPFRNFVAQARLGISPAEHEAFFREMLAHIDEPTAPFGLLNIQGDGSGIEEARREVDPVLARRLRQQARRLGVSAASLMHLAWAQVLARTTGREEVVFGTVLFGRMHGGAGADRVMGLFINTLPVCIPVGNLSVQESVRQTHARLTQLLRHEHASLVLAQRCSGVQAPAPLFSALLNYRHSAVGTVAETASVQAWEGMQLLEGEERTNYPVTLSVDDLGESFMLTAQVVASVQAQRVCDYMHTALEHLIEALETAPKTPVNLIEVLPTPERHKLLVEWNATEAEYPQEKCIHELFEEQVEKTPEAVAVVFEDQQLTYAELNARANQLAYYLRSQGVGPEVLVGICVERSLEMVIGLLGILKAGGAYVPLDPDYPADRLMYMLADSGPLALLTQESLLQRLPLTTLTIPTLALDAIDLTFDHYPSDNPDPLIVGLTSRHPAYVIYTSGSTGRSKGVMVEHRSAVNFWKVMQHSTHRNCPTHAKVALNASFTFDMSLKGLLQLLSGHCLFIVPQIIRADSRRFLNFLEQHQIDAFDCTPSQLELLLTIGWRDEDEYQPKSILIGGEAIHSQMWEKLKSYTLTKFHNMYGPTEATVDASIGLINGALDRPHIGRPIGNVQIFIIDPQGQPVPLGVAGEIYIGGIGLARGYLNRPDLTAERFLPDPFSRVPGARMYRTGDLARWLPKGNIEYLGRIDHQVKIRGFRIELGEIEVALAAIPAVQEVVVVAREDSPRDKRLVAYFVTKAGHALAEVPELRRELARSLPEYMLPAHFIPLDHLPLTPNGKVDRKALPAPDMTRSDVGYVAPRTPTEEILTQIWAEVLQLDKVGIHDNFFELGGHSLLAMKLITHLLNIYPVNLPLRSLFENPTIINLALLIEEKLIEKLESMPEEEVLLWLEKDKNFEANGATK